MGVLHLDSIVKEYVAHRCTVLQRSTLKAVVNNLIELGLSLRVHFNLNLGDGYERTPTV